MRILLLTIMGWVCAAAGAQTFEPLGRPCRAFNVLASRVVTDAAGKEWFVLSNTNETSGVELIFIDFAANTGKTFRAPAGQGAWLLNQVSGDRLIVGTYYDGKLMVFDLKTMAFGKVIAFPGEEYFWNGALGGDGRLYGGTYPHGKLGALNLETLALEDCGAPAAPNLYCRNVSAMPDGRILCNFVTSAPVTKIYDPKDKKWSDVPEQMKAVQRCVVWNGYVVSGGTWDGKEASGPVVFDGTTLKAVEPPPFPTPAGGKFSVDLTLTTSDALYLRAGNAIYRFHTGEKALTKVFAEDLRGGAITAAAGDGTLLGVRGQDYVIVRPGGKAEVKPIPVQSSPRPMHFVRADDSRRLWGGPMFGQTLFWIDLSKPGEAHNTGTVCNSGGEVYDVAFKDGKTYAVAYVGGDIVEYDPDQPWDQWNGRNPRTIAHLSSKGYIRPVAGVRVGADGKLYSGWMAAYGKYGGAIAITDPKSGETKLIENPAVEQAICSLAVDEKFIYAGTGLEGNGLPNKPNDHPQLLFIDRESGKVKFQQALGGSEITSLVLDQKTRQLAFVVDSTLLLFDIARQDFNETPADVPKVIAHALAGRGDGIVWFGTPQKQLVRLDLSDGTMRKFDAPAQVEHLCIGRDGEIFVTCGPDLYRFKPEATP